MRRAVSAFVLLAATAPGLRAEEGAQAIEAPAGETIWEASCVQCHADPQQTLSQVSWALTGQMVPERTVWLRDFILNHHAPERDPKHDKVEALSAWLAQR